MGDFSYDSTGIDPDSRGGGGSKIPEGVHRFRIVKAKPTKSAKGNFMVELEAEVINNIDLAGKSLRHWVTFMPTGHKAAGIAVHFLKVIGQPWEGAFDVTVADWVGGVFIGEVKDEPFVSKKDGKTYASPKIVRVDYVPKESEIPF